MPCMPALLLASQLTIVPEGCHSILPFQAASGMDSQLKLWNVTSQAAVPQGQASAPCTATCMHDHTAVSTRTLA